MEGKLPPRRATPLPAHVRLSGTGSPPREAAAGEAPRGRTQRLKAFFRTLPTRYKGFAYLYASMGAAGVGAKVGMVFTFGNPWAVLGSATVYASLALYAQHLRAPSRAPSRAGETPQLEQEQLADAIMTLIGQTNEAAAGFERSMAWGLRFLIWTAQSAAMVNGGRAAGLGDFQIAARTGVAGAAGTVAHVLVIPIIIAGVASADRVHARLFGGMLETAGTPLRTLPVENWPLAVTCGFGPPAILAWAAAIGTGNADMLVGGLAQSLTKSTAESAVIISGAIATVLFAACTMYALQRDVPSKAVKLGGPSLRDDLYEVAKPLLVSAERMARVTLVEWRPALRENCCKRLIARLMRMALSPPALFGVATFSAYLLSRARRVQVDDAADVGEVGVRVLATVPYACGWLLELVKGWDLSRTQAEIEALDRRAPSLREDVEQLVYNLVAARTVAWTAELVMTGEWGPPEGWGFASSCAGAFMAALCAVKVEQPGNRLAADAVLTLAAGFVAGAAGDGDGMVTGLALGLGVRVVRDWATEAGRQGRQGQHLAVVPESDAMEAQPPLLGPELNHNDDPVVVRVHASIEPPQAESEAILHIPVSSHSPGVLLKVPGTTGNAARTPRQRTPHSLRSSDERRHFNFVINPVEVERKSTPRAATDLPTPGTARAAMTPPEAPSLSPHRPAERPVDASGE